MQNQSNERIIRLPEVLSRCGLSRTMLYEKINAGEFPKQTRLGKRAVGWAESLVNAWIVERTNSSPPTSSKEGAPE